MKTKTCQGCKCEFLEYQEIDGKKRSLSARKFCLICSPYGSYAKNRKPVIDGMRQCLRCQDFKPLTDFQSRTGKKYLRSCCRVCEGQRVTEYGQDMKERAVAYLGGACQCCGYDRSMYSLHFHHVEPSQKGFTIAKFKSRKWDTVRIELDKCLLLCGNCHGEIHDGLITLVVTASGEE